MGTVKVTNIEPIADNGTLTIGNSGDTIALTSGAKTSGFGKIGQVVTGSASTQVNLTTETYTDIGLSASITPSSTSSKILVMMTAQVYLNARTTTVNVKTGGIRILRGSTNVYTPVTDHIGPFDFGLIYGNNQYNLQHNHFIDSPSTTSSITYKCQARCYDLDDLTLRFFFNGTGQQGTGRLTLMEILD